MTNPGSKREKLGRKAAVKGTMLQAHLAWAEEHLGSLWRSLLEPHLAPEAAVYARRSVLATEWIPFWALIQVDRAIAAAGKEEPDKVFYALGRQSAIQNLKGAYRAFVQEEPHRYFEKAPLLHGRFQNFGRAAYEETGARACRMSLLEYPEFSPIFCLSSSGYYGGSLEMMKSPAPRVAETACQCAGAPACVYDLSW